MKKKRRKPSTPRVTPIVPFTRPHSDRVRFSTKEQRRLAKKEEQELE